jgi:sugar fermentation stimulation protein A
VVKYSPPLVEATLLRRYKRFLADVRLSNGSIITVHCPNTGAMTGCALPESRVWLSVSENPARKYKHGWELVETSEGLACIHSSLANKVVGEALASGKIPELVGYDGVRREVTPDGGSSRIDFELGNGAESCFVEVKCVTLCRTGAIGAFPDAVSTRATRHLNTLADLSARGHRAVLLFCVFHNGIDQVGAAADIDPVYAESLRRVQKLGVEVLAYGCRISPLGIDIKDRLHFAA